MQGKIEKILKLLLGEKPLRMEVCWEGITDEEAGLGGASRLKQPSWGPETME